MNIQQSIKSELQQTLKMDQALSPQLILMLKTFQMSYIDLYDQIQHELEENVLLEVKQEDQLFDWNTPSKRTTDSDNEGEDLFNRIEDPHKTRTLYDHLLIQVELENLPHPDHDIALQLIEHIDPKGYISDFAQVSETIQKKLKVAARKVHDVLKIIQSFEPEGVGARTLKECLLLQIDAQKFEDHRLTDTFKTIIQNHLDDLGKNNWQKIAKHTQLPQSGIQSIAEFIKNNLTPNPGSVFNIRSDKLFTPPSFEVHIENHQITLINLERQKGIQLQLSQYHLQLLEKPDLDEETRQYLKQKLERAKTMIHNLERRYETSERLARFVVNHQHMFLKEGVAFLTPLLQKNVATSLGLSSSTISRLVNAKFIQTPHGTYPFKQLCPRNYFGKTKIQLQRMLKELSEKYPTDSDEKLTKKLKALNIPIARRTVAKYRQSLDISSSYRRLGASPQTPE